MNYGTHIMQIKNSLTTCLILAGLFPSFIARAAAADITANKDVANTAQNPNSAGMNAQGMKSASSNSNTVPPIPSADGSQAGAVFEVTAQRPDVKSADAKALGNTAPTSPKQESAAQMALDETKAALNAQPPSSAQSANPATPAAPHQKPAEETKTTSAAPEAAAGQPAVVPNGAALQTQLMPLGRSDSFPWSGIMAGGFLILGIAAAGVMAVRIKQGRGFTAGRSEKQLQLITSMSLSPKRQIILVRIRDKEVALASTEHGITMLTELAAQGSAQMTMLGDGGNEEPRRRKVQQKVMQDEPVKLVASGANREEDAGHETAIARSEMLMGALKNLREKNLRNRSSGQSEAQVSTSNIQTQEMTAAERKITEPSEQTRGKAESTMKQTRAAFPKYLANAFEQESKRSIPQNQTQSQSSQDEAGNVTNMIRERLKELRPLS